MGPNSGPMRLIQVTLKVRYKVPARPSELLLGLTMAVYGPM